MSVDDLITDYGDLSIKILIGIIAIIGIFYFGKFVFRQYLKYKLTVLKVDTKALDEFESKHTPQ